MNRADAEMYRLFFVFKLNLLILAKLKHLFLNLSVSVVSFSSTAYL